MVSGLQLVCLFWSVCWGLREQWCNFQDTDCHITLIVDYGMTMMDGKKLVKAIDGQLFHYDVEVTFNSTPVSSDDVITADGYFEPRLVMAFNGTIPGPALHVRGGQRVHLHVYNRMMHETTSVHIHGQHQTGSPFSDGVPFVTQCPILPGQQFDQTFIANPEGSFFYHSHSGPQMTNGLYGPFIVHPRSRSKDVVDKEFILMFHDWNHEWDSTMMAAKMRWGFYTKGKKHPTSKTLANIHYSGFIFQSGLINGKGRFFDNSGSHNGAPLSLFTVTTGKKYRFRLFHPGDVYPFRVSIDGHNLLVVSSDGADLVPFEVESVIVHPGERIDVIVTCNQTTDNYWIRGQTLEVEHSHVAEAILNYEGAPKDTEPTTKRSECTQELPCRVFNCPFLYYPLGSFTECINFDQVRSVKSQRLELTNGKPIVEYFMNFAFPGHDETPGSVNGRSFVDFPMAPLVQPHDPRSSCSREDCGNNKICHCPYSVSFSEGDLVQLVFVNMGAGRGWDHPIHLHGHSFQVVKIGFPVYNQSSGEFLNENADIDCGQGEKSAESFCNDAKWANRSWSLDGIPDMELDHPPVKDTVVVPSGGYVVTRIKANNPGLWVIHCHINLHMNDGMLALLNESFTKWPAPPSGFPRCYNFI
ncbi:laccase-1, partial [Biomphalaria glabrata]